MKQNKHRFAGFGSQLYFLTALMMFVALTAGALPNAAPEIVPSLREWNGGEGMYTLGTNSLIVIDSRFTNELKETAVVLKAGLKAITGHSYDVISLQEPEAGSLYLTLNGSDAGLGGEGYSLKIGDSVIIQARTSDGVFYATQTILQLLKRQSSHSLLPKGTAKDYPLCKMRGEMIDVGRHYYQMGYLENEIRKLAWYKMNTLHLHFTDWNGFRLVSDTYPGLAKMPAYTKADLRQLQDVARRYHVVIVPEIDLPAHAKAITDFDPQLRFPCGSMDTGHWQGSRDGGWMLDITRPEVRAWIKRLLDEFIPLFDGPYFHIGCDEWEYTDKQQACPELMNYMKAKGYKSPTDVFVEWINEVNKQVKSYGKITQMWNWWDYKQSTSIQPDKDIIINAWTASPDRYWTRGYKVIYSPEDGPEALYVSPGDGGTSVGNYGYFDSKHIYEQWKMPLNSNLMGFKVCRWSDKVEDKSDAWLDQWARRPVQVLAERVWGGPRCVTVEDFYKRADVIGLPPDYGKDE